MIKMKAYTLSEGNQNHLEFEPTRKIEDIKVMALNYSWDSYKEFDNRLIEYQYALFDEMVENINLEMTDEELWSDLSRGQKMFYSYLVFEGEVDNGGIFQFFWNRAEHRKSILEVLEVLKLNEIKEVYVEALNKFESCEGEINRLKDRTRTSKDPSKLHLFYEKGRLLVTGEIAFDKYFLKDGIKKTFNKAMSDYIETNLGQFINVN